MINWRSKSINMKKLGYSIIAVIVLILVLVFAANRYINDEAIPKGNLAKQGDRVLFIFAHPDDEMTVAGTMTNLKAQGAEIGLVYLTRGEAGSTGGLVERSELGQSRTKEVEQVRDILRVDYFKIFDYPDSGIPGADTVAIKTTILNCIDEFQPTVIVGFDETVGLYGHEDHRLAGLYLHELLIDEPRSFVRDYYMVTLPQSVIDLALKMSPPFQNRYPKDEGRGLPPPTLAVTIAKAGSNKRKVLEAHKTQWQTVKDVFPFGTSIPPFIYFRVFDREYYHKVSLED